jgi:hypothetical protein
LQNLTQPGALVRFPMGKGEWVLSAIRWDEAGAHAAKANRFASGLLHALEARFTAPAPTSTIELENFTPQPNFNWFRKEANGVYMGSGGYIEGAVRVIRAGRFRARIWGKGTPVQGVYPRVVLSVRQEPRSIPIGRVEIDSHDWAPHTFDVSLPAGEMTWRLRFVNDDARPPEDRNLWLDRIEFERIGD